MVGDDLRFLEQLRANAQAFPPAAPEREYAQRFAALGLFDAASP